MKQLSTFIIAGLLSITAFSQEDSTNENFISKGTFELTGGISFNTNNFENEDIGFEADNLALGLSPELGYAISNDLVVGTRLGFFYNENGTENTTEFVSRTYSVAAYLKKYFPVTEKFALDLQGEVEYDISNNNQDSEIDVLSVGLRPGLNYRLTDSLGFSAEIGFFGYRYQKSDRDFDNSTSRGFNASLNASDFRVALTYFF